MLTSRIWVRCSHARRRMEKLCHHGVSRQAFNPAITSLTIASANTHRILHISLQMRFSCHHRAYAILSLFIASIFKEVNRRRLDATLLKPKRRNSAPKPKISSRRDVLKLQSALNAGVTRGTTKMPRTMIIQRRTRPLVVRKRPL